MNYYPKFLWRNAIFTILVVCILVPAGWYWQWYCLISIPESPATGLMFSILGAWLLGTAAGMVYTPMVKRNRKRWKAERARTLNSLAFELTPILYEKMGRYKSFKELNDLLIMATRPSRR